MASRIAMILMGKHKPIYTAYVDTGDFVVVVNAAQVKVTGKKLEQKIYQRYSGYADGLREIPMKRMLGKHPDEVVYLAVKRMLPATRLATQMLKKLKVYAGDNHPHQAQKPQKLEL